MTATPQTPITNPQYRPCVGIALFNADGHVFVGERIDSPGAWQMPQGGIDPDEPLEIAAKRELLEETGIKDASIIHIADEKIRYELPPALAQRHWQGKYVGQEQHWVAMRFSGNDSDINLDFFDEPEFSAWKWVPLSNTIDLIVPFKRDVYARVISLFSDL